MAFAAAISDAAVWLVDGNVIAHRKTWGEAPDLISGQDRGVHTHGAVRGAVGTDPIQPAGGLNPEEARDGETALAAHALVPLAEPDLRLPAETRLCKQVVVDADKPAAAPGGARGHTRALYDRDADAARGQVERQACAVDACPDDDDVGGVGHVGANSLRCVWRKYRGQSVGRGAILSRRRSYQLAWKT